MRKRNLKKERGITLIALVVTIVVLLILAGVSINMVLGNNGLITKTKDAKEQTESSTVKDEVSMMIGEWQIEKYVYDTGLEDYLNSKVPSKIDNVTNNGDGTFTVEKDGYSVTIDEDGNIIDVSKLGPRPVISDLKVVANSDGTGDALGAKSTDEGETLYITFAHSIEGGTTTVSSAVPYAVTANGTYSFTITGTVSGETYTKVINVKVDQFKPLISALAIGDYVNYTYDTVGNYTNLTGTGSSSNPSDGIAQSATTLQWRVLNIDEENGTIDLVSATPSDNTVYFLGALGYNNGVYLLNDMCAALYSNSSRGITARSINLVDIEKHLTATGLAARNAYNNGTATYGTTKTYAGSSAYYPNLYASQKGSGINLATGATVTQPDLSGVDPYNESSEVYTTPTTEKYSQATEGTGLTVTQTIYGGSTFNFNTSGYYDEAGAVLSSINRYWVASRCAWASSSADSSYAYFGLRGAGTYMLGANIFYSYNYSINCNFRLRPVVSLSSDLLDGTKDESGAWNLVSEQ